MLHSELAHAVEILYMSSFRPDASAFIVVLWVFVLHNPAISVGLRREEVKGREN